MRASKLSPVAVSPATKTSIRASPLTTIMTHSLAGAPERHNTAASIAAGGNLVHGDNH
jgi:hypothetical protein